MVDHIPFQKIVVPLDGSKWAEKAIPHAEQIARGGGELMLIHIYRPAGSEYLSDAVIAGQTTHLDEARRRAEDYVKGLRNRISNQNLNVSAHVREGANFSQQICKFVSDEGADIVVMPAASHSKLARILMGDLSARVSGCVNACVLLVRGGLDAEWHAEAQQALAERARSAQTASTAEVAGAASTDPDGLLDHLIALRDAGILNAEEFETKKVDVLKRQTTDQPRV